MTDGFDIRHATDRDLDDLAAFEVEIARVSFGEDAVDDPAVHRAKLARALTRDPETMYVAAGPDDRAVGFAWFAVNTNFVTGQRYLNFRSLAVSPGWEGSGAGDALVEQGTAFARAHGITEITGKVHVDNHAMRVLYRRAGYVPVTLTMRRRLTGPGEGDRA
jgi:ribosomal protein S18 acetylase RimI-like enzyme